MNAPVLPKGYLIDIQGNSPYAGKKAKVIKYRPATRDYLCVIRHEGRRERVYVPAAQLSFHEKP